GKVPPGKTPPKVVLFDLDDTLFDHRFSSRAGLGALQTGFGYLPQRSLDDLERDYVALLDSVWPAVLEGRISAEQSRVIRFLNLSERHGKPLPEAEGLALSNCYREAYQLNRRAVPGALEMLGRLRSLVKIGIVTNNLIIEQQEKIAFCQIEPLIDF